MIIGTTKTGSQQKELKNFYIPARVAVFYKTHNESVEEQLSMIISNIVDNMVEMVLKKKKFST